MQAAVSVAVFQYPLRVEVGCNGKGSRARSGRLGVSVPSTGRSGLQRVRSEGRAEQRHKFQYPLRVEVGCNFVVVVRGKGGAEFQYPLRVEVGCNTDYIKGAREDYEFQYPLRVEVGCNARNPDLASSIEICFSTLYGSKWVATNFNNPHHHALSSFSTLYGSKWVATTARRAVSVKSNGFQYPLRVEVGCNWARRSLCRSQRHMFQYPLRVEVGCNDPERVRGNRRKKVSVPSTGRSGLQLSTTRRSVVMVKTFQYPLRVEVGCNSYAAPLERWVVKVSVPSTGRSGLQPKRN